MQKMYLRSVSIRGFKSFAQKTVLRFEPGVAVIVGPNGSGKSNITDAVLWALGEQSAKMLRGSSMEDVIFAGSTTKQALGVAEVSITLDNSDGGIPLDFSEVTVTRRLFRSGESEYFLNRTPCRLIDIHETLSDTGLGREMYSVISQGRLDDILNCRPVERRRLLEEAAGVLKHKRRRDRALRKMVSMEANLTRGKDILREVTRQLAPLQKQAQQAQLYNQLTQELRDVQISGSVCRLHTLRSQWEKLSLEQAAKKDLTGRLKTELEQAQARISEIENELETKGFLVGDISEYRRRLEGIQERINSGLLLLEEKGKNLVAKLSEFRQAIYQLEARIKRRQAEVEELTETKAALDSELAALYQRLAEERREAETVKKAGRLGSQALARLEQESAAERERAAGLSGEINRLTSTIESTTEKLSFLREQQAAIGEKKAMLAAEKAAAEEERIRLAAQQSRLSEDLKHRQEKIDALAARQETMRLDMNEMEKERRQAQATLAAIAALDEKQKSDLSWFHDERDRFASAIGFLVDLIQVDKKYEKAIEAALGRRIQAVVVSDRRTAVDLYRYARSSTEQPITIVAGADGAETPKAKGKLTPASLAVNCPAGCRPAVEALLGKVWLVDDLDSFLDNEQFPNDGLVVDINGDLADSRGLISRRRPGENSLGMIETQRELAELEGALRLAEENLEAGQPELDLVTAELEEARAAVVAVSSELRTMESKVMAVSLKVSGHEGEIIRLINQEDDISSRVTELAAELAGGEASLKRVRAEFEEAAARLERKDKVFKAEQADFAARMETEKAVTARLSQAQVDMASLTERQTHLKSRLVSASEDLAQARNLLAEEEKIVTATEELRHRIQPVHDFYTGLRLRAEEWARKLAETADAEQQGAAVMREELRGLHQRARDIGSDLSYANEALTAKEVAKAQVETEVGQITKHLVEELEVALETALSREENQVEPEVWRKREEEIRGQLAKLGPVNQIAAAEFSDLEDRRAFLSGQIDDLVRSQKALKKVVEAIDKKIKARFSKTFDEVNKNFNEVFQELFPGGTAGLVLVDEDSDEGGEIGVDIEAQPHGKKLQSLSLLSGGERSLVGLALLLALCYTRPSPFYILDEVEAALDDSNLRRFIKLLGRLKAEIQFLIITHQRRTMEIADCIYGVSMQADGISKVFSQKLALEETVDGAGEAELVGTAVGQPGQIQEQS